MPFINSYSAHSSRPKASIDLRKTTLSRMAAQQLKKVEHVFMLETFAQEFAHKVGDHARYSEVVRKNYGSIREEVNAICDEIRRETNTLALLRPSTPDFDSDDSTAGRGEKSTIPQV